VHADVFKMAGGLAVGNRRHSEKGDGEDEGDETEESRGNDEVLRTKKRSRRVSKMCKKLLLIEQCPAFCVWVDNIIKIHFVVFFYVETLNIM
jgi:hypothetical protein